MINDIKIKEIKALKKGSVQLPVAVWKHLENKSKCDLVSIAELVRSYVLDGIRTSIVADVEILTTENFHRLEKSIRNEFKEYLVMTIKVKSLHSGESKKEFNEIRKSLTDDEIIKYFTDNTEEFEDAKKTIAKNLYNLSEYELVKIIGEIHYLW